MGYDFMTCQKVEKRVKHFDRKKIKDVASEFYVSFYENKGSIEDLEIMDEEPLPKFMESEVGRVISTLKDKKAAGHKGITDEHIKYWGNSNKVIQ